MKDQHLQILQHSLGVDEYGQGRQYRNHYCAGPGDQIEACRELVNQGLMAEHPPSVLTGGDALFTVTKRGIQYVEIHSPKPPKLTRSQQRYEDWLSEDGSLTFGQWLKATHGKKVST